MTCTDLTATAAGTASGVDPQPVRNTGALGVVRGCYVCESKVRGLYRALEAELRLGRLAYISGMSEIPLDDASGEVAAAAHDAARGQVVYLTEHGQRLAAIVPAEIAAEIEGMSPEDFHELLEDFVDAQAAREALAEIEAGAKPIPAEQVWAELGLDE